MEDLPPSERVDGTQPNSHHVSTDPPRLSSSPFHTSLKSSHVFNVYLSTLLRTFAFISSLVAVICLLIALSDWYVNNIIILPIIVLFGSLTGHLAGFLWNAMPAMLYVEFKGKDWTGPGSGSALSLAEAGREGDIVTEIARRASRWGVRTWDSSVGVLLGANNLLAILTASSGGPPEQIVGICFAGITAALHIILTRPRFKNYRIVVVGVAFPFVPSENGVAGEHQRQEMYHDTEITDLEQGAPAR